MRVTIYVISEAPHQEVEVIRKFLEWQGVMYTVQVNPENALKGGHTFSMEFHGITVNSFHELYRFMNAAGLFHAI